MKTIFVIVRNDGWDRPDEKVVIDFGAYEDKTKAEATLETFKKQKPTLYNDAVSWHVEPMFLS